MSVFPISLDHVHALWCRFLVYVFFSFVCGFFLLFLIWIIGVFSITDNFMACFVSSFLFHFFAFSYYLIKDTGPFISLF